MTSNQHGSYILGYTRATMAVTKGLPNRKVELIPEKQSKFGLKAATRLHEVGIASNRESERHGEYVLEPCTHRPSREPSRQCPNFDVLRRTAGSVRSTKS